jgi:alpha-galactosidase
VTEADLLCNLEYMTALRGRAGFTDVFNLFQVDDGYQTAWGDWSTLNSCSFPSESLCGVAQSISDAGLTPGLWMAPFACDKLSEVAIKHPEWILKRNGSKSTPANSGNCGKWFYGLDVTRPEVAAHITACLQVATKVWGFRYLKLDFLYAAVLSDCHESYCDRSLTRAQVMQVALNIVHDAVRGCDQEVYLLGCGAPLGSLVGQVHANRISAGGESTIILLLPWLLNLLIDAGLSWTPQLPMPSWDKWNLPCARNMVRNTLCRLFMHNQWWTTDPDCLLLRDSLDFSLDEVRAIATVKALSGGSIVLSDDLKCVSSARMRIIMQLLPPTDVAAVAIDLLDREMPELLRLSLQSRTSQQVNFIPSPTEESLLDGALSVSVGTPVNSVWDAGFSGVDEGELLRSLSSEDSDDPILGEGIALRPGESRPSDRFGSAREMREEIDRLFTSLVRRDLQAMSAAAAAAKTKTSANGSSGPAIPRHIRSKSHVFVDEGTQYRRTKKRLLRLLERERAALKDDLHARWTLFSVCNWDEDHSFSWRRGGTKNHFVTVRDIFGEAFIRHVGIRSKAFASLLVDKQSRALAARNSCAGGIAARSDSISPPSSYNSVNGTSSVVNGQIASSPFAHFAPDHNGSNSVSGKGSLLGANPTGQSRYVMHLFRFWDEEYSHRVVSLDEADGQGSEVAFSDVPRRGMHLYSVGLYTDPTLPKYIGSNLHFSCGKELSGCCMVRTPPQQAMLLEARFDSHLIHRYRSFKANNARRSGRGAADVTNAVYVPILRSMCVRFDASSLRDQNYGGYIWVFLPLNPMNLGLDASFLAHNVHVSGSAVSVGGDQTPSVSSVYTSPLASLSTNPVSASAVLVSYLCERDCRVHGAVFKIAVCKPLNLNVSGSIDEYASKSDSSCGSPMLSPSFHSRSSGACGGGVDDRHLPGSAFFRNNNTLRIETEADEVTSSRGDVEDDDAFVTISWIMDVAEEDSVVKTTSA